MLDDITFPYCNEGEVPPGSNFLTCDFENDTCAWYLDNFASLLWSRGKGDRYDLSPEFDHTSGSGMYYVHYEHSEHIESEPSSCLYVFMCNLRWVCSFQAISCLLELRGAPNHG